LSLLFLDPLVNPLLIPPKLDLPPPRCEYISINKCDTIVKSVEIVF